MTTNICADMSLNFQEKHSLFEKGHIYEAFSVYQADLLRFVLI